MTMTPASVMSRDEETFAVDLVIRDTSYPNDKKDRIRGILITHGHEDHIGSLSYVLPMLDFPPVYATRLTQGLINVKLKERRLLDTASVTAVTPADRVTLGRCQAAFVGVHDSIPDAVGVVI